MTAFLLYIGKVAILLAVFYLFYRLLMERETFHRLNRTIILLSVLASFILPLCIITTHQVIQVSESANNVQEAATVQTGAPSYWPLLLLAIYMVGVAVKLGHTILCTCKLVRFINSCEIHPQKDGTSIAVSHQDIAPFSWWNTIVVSRRDYEQHNAALLAHEKVHICSYHSLDILLMELVTALQWFNPAVWLIGSELRSVHEYEADATVLGNGTDIQQYLSLLMERANLYGGYSITNHISQKQLKGRFLMMARRHSSPSRVFKVLFMLPIIIGALAVNARTIIDIEIVKQSPVAKPKISQQKQLPIDKQQPVQNMIKPKPQQQQVASQKKDTNQEKVSAPNDARISGTVLDEDGNPIVGAVIMLRDSNMGTITDFDGKFSYPFPIGSTIDVMYVGMGTCSVNIKADMAPLKITLIKEKSDNN